MKLSNGGLRLERALGACQKRIDRKKTWVYVQHSRPFDGFLKNFSAIRPKTWECSLLCYSKIIENLNRWEVTWPHVFYEPTHFSYVFSCQNLELYSFKTNLIFFFKNFIKHLINNFTIYYNFSIFLPSNPSNIFL